MNSNDSLHRALLQHLRSLQQAGVQSLPKVALRSATEATIEASEPLAIADAPASPSVIAGGNRSLREPEAVKPADRPKNRPPRPESERVQAPVCRSLSDREQALNVLQEEVASCTQCPALVRNRTQTVFGVGHINPRLCFFGEAPGADEDRVGQPFVGRAGQLLDKIIEACTLRREDVYILNTLKCRPPENRTPTEDEVENCRDFFERQLSILRPEFICCLGATAAKALLKTNLALGRLRGRFHDFRESKVIVTYHPAYLLRNPAAKKDTWEDMKMLLAEMGIPLPKS